MTEYYSHSANRNGASELVIDHLKDVAERAAEFAKPLGFEEEARLAGLLHDLGKYTSLFQRRLEGKESGLDHWSIGALAALQFAAYGATMAIEGHHTGLDQFNNNFLKRLQRNPHKEGLRPASTDALKLLERLKANNLFPEKPSASFIGNKLPETVSSMLDFRMLFSTLVDADYLETEAHFKATPGEKKTQRAPGLPLQPEKALSVLQKYIVIRRSDLEKKGAVDQRLMKLRSELLKDCLEAGGDASGLFTLSAPTGSGKTLSMLAFALSHALAHGKQFQRIIMVIPYLSIIEQTVAVCRKVFGKELGDQFILEHHSMAGIHSDPVAGGEADNHDPDCARARQLSENWDAPLIVTTSVQMLESLFANRPSACRKLHRISGSIILFDEVQTLPVSLAIPTLKALSHLSARYDSTVVFSTATQPAFSALDAEICKEQPKGWRPREIVRDAPTMFHLAKRTRVIPPDLEKPISWSALAEKLAEDKQALCIVNLKRHAIDLLNHLENIGAENLYHLSTNLCPAHRTEVLISVREQLDNGESCHLISTQCIEAGVDVDFPVVYRAFGPLEAIAQAAGRCNRNGKLPSGDVNVFLPDDEGYPPGEYQQAVSVLHSLVVKHGPDWLTRIDDPEIFKIYYEKLYSISDPKELNKQLQDAIKNQDFVKVAECYRLIRQDVINVLVPYDLKTFRDLRDRARNDGLSAVWIREARPYTVSVFRPRGNDTNLWDHLENVPLSRRTESADWFFCRDENAYDRVLIGLMLPEKLNVQIA